ncbi:MAG: cation transporter [Candidatus Altiarchaeota archaeon]|nr:cation transporter [Candidatus Altiarchaeota archaeon]
MDSKTFKVAGMHCKSCEMLVNEELSEIGNIKETKSDHKAGTVTIKYDKEPDMAKVKKAVEDLGYKVNQ